MNILAYGILFAIVVIVARWGYAHAKRSDENERLKREAIRIPYDLDMETAPASRVQRHVLRQYARQIKEESRHPEAGAVRQNTRTTEDTEAFVRDCERIATTPPDTANGE